MTNVVVIGGSAGSIDPLRAIVRSLPSQFPAALFVVIHTHADAESVLPKLLARAGALPARHAAEGLGIEEGQIYVAPPDHHVTITPGKMHVSRGPRENSHRPAIDPLFRSAAESYRRDVTSVLLSGMGGDGAAGMLIVKQHGGRTIIQQPDEAQYPNMLRHAAVLSPPDFEVPSEAIGPLLTKLARITVANEGVGPMQPHEHPIDPTKDLSSKHPSQFSCPECGGVLWEDMDGQIFGLRCRVGHVYSYDSLLDEQTQHIESALWAGLRALEEKAALLHKMAGNSRQRQQPFAATRFEEGARELEGPAETLRKLLEDGRLYGLPQRETDGNGHDKGEP